ncbi:Receptor-like protein 12 [Linum grandiflorum]
MKLHLLSLSILILVGTLVCFVSGRCQGDQHSLLLQLRQGLIFDQSYSAKLSGWNASTNCCKWSGITCDHGGLGRVVGLDLSYEFITGGLDDSTALFSLQFLQSLDLSFNSFDRTIPSGLANLTSLRYLFLREAGFYGQVPAAISRMTSLLGLDLSFQDEMGTTSLRNPNLAQLVQNLTRLVDLRIDFVDLSTQGKEWCKALSSSLPNLQVLTMSNCLLSGPIDPSLSKLQHLSILQLDHNNFSSPVPEVFAYFKNLTCLSMHNCELKGAFPAKIFQLPSLEFLDLSYNERLEGVLPDFPQNHSMDTLLLSQTNFSGVLPPSIGSLGKLSRIELAQSHFSGIVPKTLERLTQLEYMDLSFNNFTGILASLDLFKNLMHVDISHNQLAGSIPTQSESFEKLVYADLSHDSLNETIPPSLFASPYLDHIDLSFNELRGMAPHFPNVASSSALEFLDLSYNHLQGPIPPSFFKFPRLQVLYLHSNKFNGSVQFSWVQKMQNLANLDLSYNNLTVDVLRGNNSSNVSIFPQLSELRMPSCNLRAFPELGNQSLLTYLDLSDNNINGVVPRWILESTSLYYLNVSHNNLVGLQLQSVSLPALDVLDMHANQFQGPLNANYLATWQNMMIGAEGMYDHLKYQDRNNTDYEDSVTVSSKGLQWEFVKILKVFKSIDFSSNNFDGQIPQVMGKFRALLVLNLSHNALTGALMLPAALWPSFRIWYWPKVDYMLVWMIPKLYTKDWNNRLVRTRKGRA